ncbi:hypothetical protein ACFLU9_01070 [Chloroflexota bacterium]
MNSLTQKQAGLIEGLLLVAVLMLAYFMSSIPHWHYQYPLHIDEWWRYGDAQSLIETESITHPNPFEAGETLSPDIEAGFHLFLGELKLITGVSWLSLFRYLPGIILAMLAFQAYVFGKRKGLGLGAASLATLIPTSVRFLGPAFLLPVSLGLVFIPLTLFVLHRLMSGLRGPIILFLILLALLFIHPPTFAVVSAITVIHLVLFLLPGKEPQSRARQSVLALVFIVPIYGLMFFWAPSFIDFVVNEAMQPELHLQLPPIQNAVFKFGYIPATLFALGIGILARQGKRDNWAIVLSAVGLLAFLLLYPRFYIGPDIIYERGWLYFFVLMALLGGVALKEIWGWAGRGNMPSLATVSSYAVIGILVASAFAMSLRSHLTEPYYHVIDDINYQDFLWVREYTPPQYQVGVLDTAKAWAFAAVTGKFAYTAEVSPNFHAKGRSAMEFLENGARDTSWLVERGINIVYSSEEIDNNQLIKVNNNLYLLARD